MKKAPFSPGPRKSIQGAKVQGEKKGDTRKNRDPGKKQGFLLGFPSEKGEKGGRKDRLVGREKRKKSKSKHSEDLFRSRKKE